MYIFETAQKEELNITLEKLSLWYEYNNYQIIAGLIQNCKNRYEYPFTVYRFLLLKSYNKDTKINLKPTIEDGKLISLVSKIFSGLMPITLKDFNLYKNFLLSKVKTKNHHIWFPPISKDKFYIDEIPHIIEDLSFMVTILNHSK